MGSDFRLLGGIVLALALVSVVSFYVLIALLSHTPRPVYSSELEYSGVETSGQLLSIEDSPAEVEISVVVPCYNEEARLHLLMSAAAPFLKQKFGRSWEILIVDDGSKDNTRGVAFEWAENLEIRPNFRFCKLNANRGKGGAVTHGIKCSRGKMILFADADNASDFRCLENLYTSILGIIDQKHDAAIAIGSRAHLTNSQQVIKRSAVRNFLMRCFHLLVYWFGIRDIRDTQCGFKLFTRSAAKHIFPYMHTEGWIFDVETLVLANRKKIPVVEIPISWHEVTGSKIDLARDSIKMAIDLVVIRFAYLFGIYRDSTRTAPRI